MRHENTFHVMAATRGELGELAGHISAWRTDQYLAAGFYDPALVGSLRMSGIPIESNRPDDYEVVALDSFGQILATLSLRRPAGCESHLLSDTGRPEFGLEAVHGTRFLSELGALPMDGCWEAGRFLRDRSTDSSQAVAAVAVAGAELVVRLARQGRADVVVGEVEPDVALRHLRALELPLIVGPPLDSPRVSGLLASRYRGRRLVPFALRTRDLGPAQFQCWQELRRRSHLLEALDAAA